MTQAVCTLCGSQKLGAWTACPNCYFTPQTVLELTVALSYSGEGEFNFDLSMVEEVKSAIRAPDFRGMLTLRRTAKDTLFSKQLNVHEIGPDGYHGYALKRGRDIDRAAFDAIRSADDGDLYLIVSYEHGERRRSAVTKGKWYAFYDLMLLTEREAQPRPKLQMIYEKLCRNWIEECLAEA